MSLSTENDRFFGDDPTLVLDAWEEDQGPPSHLIIYQNTLKDNRRLEDYLQDKLILEKVCEKRKQDKRVDTDGLICVHVVWTKETEFFHTYFPLDEKQSNVVLYSKRKVKENDPL